MTLTQVIPYTLGGIPRIHHLKIEVKSKTSVDIFLLSFKITEQQITIKLKAKADQAAHFSPVKLELEPQSTASRVQAFLQQPHLFGIHITSLPQFSYQLQIFRSNSQQESHSFQIQKYSPIDLFDMQNIEDLAFRLQGSQVDPWLSIIPKIMLNKFLGKKERLPPEWIDELSAVLYLLTLKEKIAIMRKILTMNLKKSIYTTRFIVSFTQLLRIFFDLTLPQTKLSLFSQLLSDESTELHGIDPHFHDYLKFVLESLPGDSLDDQKGLEAVQAKLENLVAFFELIILLQKPFPSLHKLKSLLSQHLNKLAAQSLLSISFLSHYALFLFHLCLDKEETISSLAQTCSSKSHKNEKNPALEFINLGVYENKNNTLMRLGEPWCPYIFLLKVNLKTLEDVQQLEAATKQVRSQVEKEPLDKIRGSLPYMIYGTIFVSSQCVQTPFYITSDIEKGEKCLYLIKLLGWDLLPQISKAFLVYEQTPAGKQIHQKSLQIIAFTAQCHASANLRQLASDYISESNANISVTSTRLSSSGLSSGLMMEGILQQIPFWHELVRIRKYFLSLKKEKQQENLALEEDPRSVSRKLLDFALNPSRLEIKQAVLECRNFHPLYKAVKEIWKNFTAYRILPFWIMLKDDIKPLQAWEQFIHANHLSDHINKLKEWKILIIWEMDPNISPIQPKRSDFVLPEWPYVRYILFAQPYATSISVISPTPLSLRSSPPYRSLNSSPILQDHAELLRSFSPRNETKKEGLLRLNVPEFNLFESQSTDEVYSFDVDVQHHLVKLKINLRNLDMSKGKVTINNTKYPCEVVFACWILDRTKFAKLLRDNIKSFDFSLDLHKTPYSVTISSPLLDQDKNDFILNYNKALFSRNMNRLMLEASWCQDIYHSAVRQKCLVSLFCESSHNPHLKIAAANAMSVLVYAGANLSARTFVGIQVPHAYLNSANFEGSTFINCNFSHCHVHQSNLNNARFSQCNVTGMDFGQLPSLRFNEEGAIPCFYSSIYGLMGLLIESQACVYSLPIGQRDYEIYFQLPMHRKWTCLCISPDEVWMGSGDTKGTVTIWDLKTKKSLFGFSPCQGQLSHMSFSATREYLALKDENQNWQLWKMKSHAIEGKLSIPYKADELNHVVFHPRNGHVVVVSLKNGDMEVVDLVSSRKRTLFKGILCTDVNFSESGQYLTCLTHQQILICSAETEESPPPLAIKLAEPLIWHYLDESVMQIRCLFSSGRLWAYDVSNPDQEVAKADITIGHSVVALKGLYQKKFILLCKNRKEASWLDPNSYLHREELFDGKLTSAQFSENNQILYIYTDKHTIYKYLVDYCIPILSLHASHDFNQSLNSSQARGLGKKYAELFQGVPYGNNSSFMRTLTTPFVGLSLSRDRHFLCLLHANKVLEIWDVLYPRHLPLFSYSIEIEESLDACKEKVRLAVYSTIHDEPQFYIGICMPYRNVSRVTIYLCQGHTSNRVKLADAFLTDLPIDILQFHRNEKVLFFSCREGSEITKYNFIEKTKTIFHVPKDRILHFDLSEEAHLLICSTLQKKICVWNIETGKLLYQFETIDLFQEVHLSTNGRQIVGINNLGREISVWEFVQEHNVPKMRLLWTLPNTLKCSRLQIDNPNGLTPLNRKLLIEKGATIQESFQGNSI